MFAFNRLVVPKALLLLLGVSVCLPIATAKDEHQRRTFELRSATLNITNPIDRSLTLQSGSLPLATPPSYGLEQPLIATLDVVKLSPGNVLYLPAQRTTGDFALVEEAAQAQPIERFGLQLPQPDRWSAVLATLALALFFFVRRLV